MWREQAACRGLPNDWFFIESDFELGKRICRRCPVQGECLAYAIKTKSFGIWGGVGAADRGVFDMNVSRGARRAAKRTTTEGKTITIDLADNRLLEAHE